MSKIKEILWAPKKPEKTAMYAFLKRAEKTSQRTFPTYLSLHQWSIEEPALFWQEVANYFNLHFNTPPQNILNEYKHPLEARWFEGATLNFAEHLLREKDNKIAIISINEQGVRETCTFLELKKQVAACAAGLKALNVAVGDRVVAVMPNCSQTIIAMLATASIGAIWSSCSPDFGAEAIIDRLGQVEPKVLFICDGHCYMGKTYASWEKIEKLTTAMPTLEKVVLYPFLKQPPPLFIYSDHFVFWNDFLQKNAKLVYKPLPFDHPLYILFSSGTTGKPKCIVHGAGNTLIQHLKELGLHTNLTNKDNLCFFTTCGWMMWNWMVSALALGTTLTLYEGAPTYPNVNRLFQLIEEERITVFGTSAKFISTVEKEKFYPVKHYAMSELRTILSTGSPLLPNNYDFIETKIKPGIQISSISGGTDIISCFALGNPLVPVYRGELQCLGLGLAVQIFNEEGKAIVEEKGELVCTQAFPSMPIGFWQDTGNKAYFAAYFDRFPAVWAHRDYALITADSGLIIYGRSDATLNPGGVRIGTAEIYRQIELLPEIVDAIVIGQNWQDDVRIVLFVKLQDGLKMQEALQKTIRDTIRKNASPRHVPAKIIQVPDIPHTLNGKLVELAVRQMVHGEKPSQLESLANPESLQYFKDLADLKY